MTDSDDATFRCTKCHVTKPLARFPKQRNLKRGHGSWCTSCVSVGNAARQARKLAERPHPGALVLVPAFPAPPPVEQPPAAQEQPIERAGTMRAAVHAFVAKLDPPPGDLDRPLIVALYRVADSVDDAQMALHPGVQLNQGVTTILRIQRELLGTRASRPAGQAKPKPGRSKLDAFRDAL